MADAQMLINQAKSAFDEAKLLTDMANMKRKEIQTDVENAIEKAEQEFDEPDKAKYWQDHATEVQSRGNSEAGDLEQKASAKRSEGIKYESQARAAAAGEKDGKKRDMFNRALDLFM